MKKYFWILFLLIFSIVKSNAQINKNTIFAEFLGNAVTYSLNYDRIIKSYANSKFSFRIGYSIIPIDKIIGLPIEFNYFIGNKHNLEIGSGLSYVQGLVQTQFLVYDAVGDYESISKSIYYTLRIGYRYQSDSSRLFFRAGFIPFIKIYEFDDVIREQYEKMFNFSFGIAFGYSF